MSQIDFAFAHSTVKEVGELVLLLSKKRGQPVKAQIDLLRRAMTFIDKIEDKDSKMAFVRTLKDACEKKIYLEVGCG